MTIEYRRAEPTDADALAGLYTGVYGGGYSLVEFTRTESIRALLEAGSYSWYVGVSGGTIAGSSVAVPHAWNMSFEIGKTAVVSGHRGREIAKRTCRLACEDASRRGFGVSWGSIRNVPMQKIAAGLGMEMVGYTQQHKPGNRRESQIICQRLHEEALESRVAPGRSGVQDLPLVQSLERRLGLQHSPSGEYPADVVVGPPARGAVTLALDYHAADDAAIVSGLDGDLPGYIQVTLLADKVDAIRKLERFGFRMAAWLPGWYLAEGSRYDCVVMANADVAPGSEIRELNRWIEGFVRGFGEVGRLRLPLAS